MTKIYLVYAQGCHSDGSIDVDAKKYVAYVYSNHKLAEKCADYLNKEWKLGLKRNTDFKKDSILFYYVITKIISKKDYGKIPF